MTETTTEQLAEIEGQGDTVQVREGRWRTRGGAVKNIRPCEPLRGAYFVWPWTDGFMTFQDNGLHQGSKESPNDLVEYLGPIEPDKTQELPDKTQELETKTQELPEYTPPEGWRLVRFGEQLLPGDMWVNHDGTEQRSAILHWDASAVSGGRCIRRIGPQPEPQAESHTEQQIEELRSEVSYVQRLLGESRQRVTQLEELVGSLRNINEAQEKAFEAAGKQNDALRLQVENRQQEYDRQKVRIEFLETLNAGYSATFGEYKAKIERLQGLVDFARKQLEDAANEISQQRSHLDAYEKQLDQKDAQIRALQIELDAAQQVPQAIADRFEEGWNQGTARAVETVLEWLEPVRAVDNEHLANETLQHLPQIMRHLVGLDSPEDVD